MIKCENEPRSQKRDKKSGIFNKECIKEGKHNEKLPNKRKNFHFGDKRSGFYAFKIAKR
jgi:hypothetical protein